MVTALDFFGTFVSRKKYGASSIPSKGGNPQLHSYRVYVVAALPLPLEMANRCSQMVPPTV